MKRKNIFLLILTFTLSLVLNTPAFAQVGGGGGTGGGAGVLDQFKTLATKLGEVVTVLIPVAFTAALLFFFWGLAKFILNPEDRDQGKNLMLWGIIALFVISSVWGLTKILGETVGIDTTITTVPVPGVKNK